MYYQEFCIAMNAAQISLQMTGRTWENIRILRMQCMKDEEVLMKMETKWRLLLKIKKGRFKTSVTLNAKRGLGEFETQNKKAIYS